jgi:hypothetical protein
MVDLLLSKMLKPTPETAPPNKKFFPKMEGERGVPEQQIVAFKRGNSNEEDIKRQKWHWRDKFRYIAYKRKCKWKNQVTKGDMRF